MEFSSFSWSPNETKILYIAEKKTTHEPFYKRKSEKTAESNDSPVATKVIKKQNTIKIKNYFYNKSCIMVGMVAIWTTLPTEINIQCVQ